MLLTTCLHVRQPCSTHLFLATECDWGEEEAREAISIASPMRNLSGQPSHYQTIDYIFHNCKTFIRCTLINILIKILKNGADKFLLSKRICTHAHPETHTHTGGYVRSLRKKKLFFLVLNNFLNFTTFDQKTVN